MFVVGKKFFFEFFRIVDFANACDGVRAVVRSHDERLGIEIGNASDAHVAFHLRGFFFEFGSERRVLNLMDCFVDSAIFPNGQTRSPST